MNQPYISTSNNHSTPLIRTLVRLTFTQDQIQMTVPAAMMEDINLYDHPQYWMALEHMRNFADGHGEVRFFAHANLAAESLDELDINFENLQFCKSV